MGIGEDDATRMTAGSSARASSDDDDEKTVVDGAHHETLPRGQPTHEPEQGASIGRFVVLDVVGEGGMGAVYRAYDPKLQREVAVKVLKGAAGEAERARVLREAQALAQLNHPNVVAVYDTGEHEGGVFIAMEFVLGVDLRGWLKQQRPWREVLEVSLQAGRGLAAAHASGLVHRDFKPANVLVGEDGRVRVVDFGLAKGTGEPEEDLSVSVSNDTAQLLSHADVSFRRSSLSEALTEQGIVMGTPAYMAPEQHFGRPADARADQFAYCATLFEALCGQKPFDGDGIRELAKAKLTPLKAPPSSTPRWVVDIVLRGLAPKPENRWPSMDTLLDALSRDPTVARRRWLALGAVAALGAVVVGGVQVRAARIAGACADEGAAISETWGDATREQLRAAFEATELPHATSTYDKTRPWLDRYAQRWAALRERACLDGEEETKRATSTLTIECLDERRDRLAALVSVFMEADATSLPFAVTTAATLPDLEQCTDPTWLTRRPRPPEDEATRAQIREIRSALSTASTLSTAGKYKLALAQARPLLEPARATGHAPLVVDVSLALAHLEDTAGDFERARELSEDAFHQAIQIDADEDALAAATSLIFHVGVSLMRHDQGLAWGRMGQSLVTRLDEQGSLQDAAVQDYLGSLHQQRTDYDAALEHYGRALEIREKQLPPEHPGLGRAYSNLGRLYRARGEYAQALEMHARAREICEQTLGAEHPCVGTSLLDIGHVEEGQGAYAQAKEHYEKALEIYERTYGPDHPRTAWIHRPLGLVHLVTGDMEMARHHYERALEINEAAVGPEHPNLATGLNSLGVFHKTLREYERARDYFERAAELRERSLGPEHREYARALLNLGSVETMLGNHQRALDVERRALGIFEARLGESHPDIAWSLTNIADVHRNLGQHEEAVRLADRALAMWGEWGGPDIELAHTKVTLALSLLALDRELERAHRLALESRAVWVASGPPFAWIVKLIDDARAAHPLPG